MTHTEKAAEHLKEIKCNDDVCENKRKNYNSFDLAKFICSILVVIIHVPPFGKQESTNIFSYLNFVLQSGLCRMAVPLFFVFSGFFLYKKTPLVKFSMQPTKKYLTHILQIYVIWSLVYLPLSTIVIMRNSKDILYGLIKYIRNFFLIGSYVHLWYLNALIIAVIIVSFLLYKNVSPKKILYISLVFYGFGLLGDGYFGIISPLLNLPVIGEIIRLYFKIFVYTRNGLFFAFFFVSLGMILSTENKLLSAKKALFLFLVSLLMMCTESMLLKTFNIAKDFNILLFAIPSTIFCFMFLESLNLKDRKIYKSLRVLSSLIFFGHLWVDNIVWKCLSLLNENLYYTPIRFIATLSLTIIIAWIVMNISERKMFHWLKKMY